MLNRSGSRTLRLTCEARGVCPIAPTPFVDGRVHVDSIDRLTDFYVGCGATGIAVPCLQHLEARRWYGIHQCA